MQITSAIWSTSKQLTVKQFLIIAVLKTDE